jgi:hypothetical protein
MPSGLEVESHVLDCINSTDEIHWMIAMRIAYGEGVIVAIILPFVFLLLGLIKLYDTLFLVLLLFGLWTIVSALVLARLSERNFYLTWGLILSCISTIFVIQVAYAIALVLIAIIASLVINVSTRKSTGSTNFQAK